MALNYWIFVIITLGLLSFISYGTYQTARLLKHWQPDRNLLLLPAETGIRLVLIGSCLALGGLSGRSRAELGWVATNWVEQIGWGLLWGSGLALFFYLTTRRLIDQSGERFYSTIIIKAITPTNRQEFLLVWPAMASVVLVEELLFRSLLIGGLRPLLPLPLLVIGWSLLFGLLHWPQGSWGMIGAGLAGLLLSYLFIQAESLLLPLVAHYVTNMIQVMQAMRLGYGTEMLLRGEEK